MLIKVPTIDNNGLKDVIIVSTDIVRIKVFEKTIDIVFKSQLANNEYLMFRSDFITCPIHVLTHLESILDIVDLTKPQKDPF